jgi:hypothetical protein
MITKAQRGVEGMGTHGDIHALELVIGEVCKPVKVEPIGLV